MNSYRLALGTTALALAGAMLAPPAIAAPGDEVSVSNRRSCGLIESSSIYKFARVIAIRGVSCPTARRVAKAYDNRSRQLGSWRCGLAREQPRLFSCGAGAGRGDLRKRPRALEAIGTNSRGSSAEASRCGSVSYGGRAYVLFYKGIGCTSARRKVRYVHRVKRLRGWKCSSGSGFRTGGFCSRGRLSFGWHPGD